MQEKPAKKRVEEEPNAGWTEPTTVMVKPPEQLDLNEKELAADQTRILSAKDPSAPHNITRYSFQLQSYKLDASVEQMATHFEMQGNLYHHDDEQGVRILAGKEAAEEANRRAAEAEQMGAEAGATDATLHRNQFNFSERACQTAMPPHRDRQVATQPPPSVVFSNTAGLCEIFDAYTEDLQRQRIAKDKAAEAAKASKNRKEDKVEDDEAPDDSSNSNKDMDMVHSAAMQKSLKIMERMLNQNTYDEIAQDFRFWDDASDGFKEGEGTLLPLWKFWSERARRKHVTALCWNPHYNDLFAVGYGSYDFMKQASGLICCFSLKNPSHPEYSFTTETGVMCLHFHPNHPSLLAVGCYDGTVVVFDIRNKLNKPIFHSTVKTGKHTDPVWQVTWQKDDGVKSLNFFSISSDGRVTLWTLSKNELEYTDIMELKLTGLVTSDHDEQEETSLVGLAGGCCMDFNSFTDHLFFVGTEEGRMHKCSKAYNSQYLETYEGHLMAIYAVRCNHFHPRVFLSASADWTVKLWDHQSRHPLMSFDLGNAVGDVEWAPYSSSVFAAVTNDGKVHVFDLAENKHEAMCDQKVVRKSKVTHVAFNPNPDSAILLVGDDRGGVLALKLSPNLRRTEAQKRSEAKASEGVDIKKAPPKKKGAAAAGGGDEGEAKVQLTAADMEVEKLDKLLGLSSHTTASPTATAATGAAPAAAP